MGEERDWKQVLSEPASLLASEKSRNDDENDAFVLMRAIQKPQLLPEIMFYDNLATWTHEFCYLC